MPIYEYRCDACGHELEVMRKMSDAPLVECPSCGKPALSKLVSAAGFQLKGSGWYVTDFRDNKKAKDAVKSKDDQPAGAASATKDGGADGAAAESKDNKAKDSKSEGSAASTTSSQA